MSNKDKDESINKNKLKSNKSKGKIFSQTSNVKSSIGGGLERIKALAESNKERNRNRNRNGTKKYNNNNISNNNNNNNIYNSNRYPKFIRDEKDKMNEIGGKKASNEIRNKRQNTNKIKNSVNSIDKGSDNANNYGYDSRMKDTNKEEIKKEIDEKTEENLRARQIILDRKKREKLIKDYEERQKKEKEMKEKEEKEKEEREERERQER